MLIEMIGSEAVYHPDKERALYVRDWTGAVFTGKGQDKVKAMKPGHKDEKGNYSEESLLTIYRPRETEIEKDQLVRLHNPFTCVPAGAVASIFDKVRRTDGIEEVIIVEGKEEEIAADLKDFYGGMSLKDWCFEAQQMAAFSDPNSFAVFEFEPIYSPAGATIGVNTYPVIFNSADVANFKYKHGKLYWFLGEHTRYEIHNQEQVKLSTFYFYAKGFGWCFREVYDVRAMIEMDEEIVVIEVENNKPRIFAVSFKDMMTTAIPVARVGGAYPDPETHGETRIGPLHFAEHQFHDLIRDKSLVDVLHVLHAYLQKYAYAPECTYEDPNLSRCDEGYLHDVENGTDHICPACHGTGAAIHTTPQGVILLKFRKLGEGEQLVPLTDLVNYVQLPLEVLQYIQERVEGTTRYIQKAILGTTVISQDEIKVEETATARLLDVDAAMNRVQPHVQQIQHLYEVAVQACADYWETTLEQGSLQVPTDYNIEGIPNLIAKFEAAKKAQLSQAVLDAFEAQILQKLYRNSPVALQKMKAFKKHQPFRDKTPEVIAMIVGARSELDMDRVLYENWYKVPVLLDVNTGGTFHEMTYDRQRQELDKVYQSLIAEIQYNKPEPMALPAFGGGEPDEDNV